MPSKTAISVVLPAHNEAPNIEAVVGRCVSVCSELFSDFEALVVDDGSTDGTGAIVEAIARDNPRVKLISHPVNLGYGAALRSGFEAASYQWTFFTDSDGQFDLGEMADFVPLLAEADIVAGYRISRQDNLYRRFLGWTYTTVMNLFFGVKVRDVNCAFKFIRSDLLKSFTLLSEGALINAEMLAIARRKKLRIVEKGVHHYPRPAGEQSGGSARVISRAIKEFANLYLRLRK